MTIIEAIKIRSSCRTYSNKPILPHQFVALYNFLEANKEAPFGSKVRFQLIDLNELEIGELKNLGTYGVIKGARHFMVGAVVKAPGAMEDYGYCMEKNILELLLWVWEPAYWVELSREVVLPTRLTPQRMSYCR